MVLTKLCLLLACSLVGCFAQNGFPPKGSAGVPGDVDLVSIVNNISSFAGQIAAEKNCEPQDELCNSLKTLGLIASAPTEQPSDESPAKPGQCAGKTVFTYGDDFLGTEPGYCLPLTNLTARGTQNRDTLMLSFPSQTNPAQFPSTMAAVQNGNTLAGSSELSSFVVVPPTSLGGWTLLTSDSGNTMIHATPLSNGQVMIMERPGNREPAPFIGAIYNLYTGNYRYFPMTDSPFCSGHVRLIDETILIVGGDNLGTEYEFQDGRYSVRRFVPGSRPFYNTTDYMRPYFNASVDPNSGARWYPTLLTMVDNNVLIVSGATTDGGVNTPTYQVYLYATEKVTPNQYMAQLRATSNNALYPFMAVLPSGVIMVISGAVTQFYRYNTTTYLLSNDTTTYPPVPNLPIPICYPLTATVAMLPLELPNYNPRILVLGGSTSAFANNSTPASNGTWLLDFSVTPFAWQQEDMSSPRLMPNAILLPDGTVGIVNGADTGQAGGTPGVGYASNNMTTDNQQAEIYNTSAPYGSRMSGLLASSGRDRLYHSVAWLTPNAEILVSGSEVTEDYTIQIFTPPYLEGNFSRPVLGNPSVASPGYGATVSVPVTWTGGPPASISRVVVYRLGGITHSVHMDQRQVACVFSATTASLTVTMPPSVLIATPGVYSIFAVTSSGRPSNGVNVGLGGAVPLAPFYEPVQQAVLPNGNYTISNIALSGCASGNVMSGGTCNQGNLVTVGLAGTWTLTLIPSAPDNNTYSVLNAARAYQPNPCNANLSCPTCTYGNFVDQYNEDDLSGRQRWTINPSPSGGYTIQVQYGRLACGQYISAVSCANSTIYLETGDLGHGLQSWSFAAVTPPAPAPPPPTTPPFTNGNYTINNLGRTQSGCSTQLTPSLCSAGNGVSIGTSGSWTLTLLNSTQSFFTYEVVSVDRVGQCNPYLSCQDCGGNLADIYYQDDNSGRQQWTFTPVSGGYYIQVLRGRPTCGQNLVASSCASTAAVFMDAGTSNLSVWQVQPVAPFANGQYSISNLGRNQSSCSAQLSPSSCSAGNGVSIGSSGYWALTLLNSSQNYFTYEVVSIDREQQCNAYLSCQDCGGSLADLYYQDDNSGRQQWTFTPVSGGYYIQVLRGRPTCGQNLVASSCASSSAVYMDAGTSTLSIWQVLPRTGSIQYFPNGRYNITSPTRIGKGCNGILSGQTCTAGNGVNLDTPSTGDWTFTYLPSAPYPNTYEVVNTMRAGSCNQFLSCTSCGADVIDLYNQDDNSGRQQWVFNQTAGGYYIQVLNGRNTCNQYVSAPASCSVGQGLNFAATPDGTGNQIWSVVMLTQQST